LPIKQKTLSGNALRGHLAKFGLVASKGIGRVDAPIAKAATGAALPDIAKAALQAAENRRQRVRPTCVRVRARFFRLARSNAAAKRARRQDPLAALRASRAFDALRSGAGLYHQTGQVVHQTAARAGRSNRGSSDCGGAASLARGRRARGKASGEIGWPRFFRASPRDWSPSLWPTSLHGSFQPLRRPARRFARRS
jgi:hypothetical protein